MIFYELWDSRTGNLLGSYGSETEALALVRELLASDHASDDLELIRGDEDDEERDERVARGRELAARALAAKPLSA